jgi:aminopeptidase YwaD
LNKEYFPLAYSAATTASGSPAIALQERGEPWFMDLKEILESGSGNTHFDLEEAIREQVAVCAKKGATALILYNSSSKLSDKLVYDPGARPVAVSIPVVYITKEAKRKYLKDESASLDIKLKVGFAEKSRTEHNVVGFLDNGAATTVVIGAHYDYGGGANNGDKGWADNVSGVAAAVELARMLKDSKLKGNNYLFVAFAGEQKELRGSGYFVEHLPVDDSKVNYLIDMDRVGWLSDSSHLLMIGGNSTSLVWGTVCNKVVDKKLLSLQFDGNGAGDPVIFYRKGIPLLFFCTGACSPGGHLTAGGLDNINYMGELQVLKFVYSIIQNINGMGRIAFTKTKEPGL